MERYTAESIRSAVTADEARLFASWSAGRPEGWKCDSQVKDSICIGNWMSEELSRLITQGFSGADNVPIDDADRKIQQQMFNRWARSRTDLFELATEIMNDVIDGKVARDRIPHHRWG